jgi:hypothetical protein
MIQELQLPSIRLVRVAEVHLPMTTEFVIRCLLAL